MSGRHSLEVSYDPRDPSKAVRADGTGRWAPLIILLIVGFLGLSTLAGFFGTPF
ncbi:DUF3592 domain-containing protein [Streptomyces purpureus]|uniref:Uncharacterized protein n=1 Tax=Streptomyces purpureus TaxID=1951 RepID=A0A918LW15_9ACTN|nr:DUF3592 domain-containing protein [Streptomyces purpureus]GGT58029.1 hypothetical protein GCM10014713_59550 [Streptomyces purpureus]